MFENRAAALFALAALLITTTYINQLYFSFRIVYLVPLLTCFIFGFLRTGEAWRLVMAAVVALASVFGSLPYFIIYHTIYGVLLMALPGLSTGARSAWSWTALSLISRRWRFCSSASRSLWSSARRGT